LIGNQPNKVYSFKFPTIYHLLLLTYYLLPITYEMYIIPAIDIIEGKCVRLTHGDYNQKKIYNENPLEVAKEFEGAGIERLHLVDLDEFDHRFWWRYQDQQGCRDSL